MGGLKIAFFLCSLFVFRQLLSMASHRQQPGRNKEMLGYLRADPAGCYFQALRYLPGGIPTSLLKTDWK